MIAAPIVKNLRKNAKINIHDPEYIEAFEKLKRILTSPPLLAFPNFSKKFVLTTDASDLAIGAVLSQEGRPLCFASRTLNGFETSYHINEKEWLAIVWAIKYFRPYLYGRKFLVQTDNQPLKWLYDRKEPSPRALRWKILLGEYDFEIDYIQGKENKVADYLSRPELEKNELENASLHEQSIETAHSAAEDSNKHFLISDFLVNKYTTQIRLVKTRHTDVKKLYNNKYTVLYVSTRDLHNNCYLTDLFRKFIRKGKVGVHTELPLEQYNMVPEKLIAMYASDSHVSFTLCKRVAIDIESKEEMLKIIEETHVKGNHRGINENYERLKWEYFYPNLQKLINITLKRCYDRLITKKRVVGVSMQIVKV